MLLFELGITFFARSLLFIIIKHRLIPNHALSALDCLAIKFNFLVKSYFLAKQTGIPTVEEAEEWEVRIICSMGLFK